MNFVLEPYLQRKGKGWRNPLTGLELTPDHGLCALIDQWRNGQQPSEEAMRELRVSGWAVPDLGNEAGDRYVLRYVNLEATSRCNQRCHFCPVSISQRPDVQMSSERFAGVVGDLALMKKDIQGVFLFGYNEPSLDRRLTERVELLHQHGLPVALNTNGSGFVPKLTDALRALGGIRLLSVNLSTLDPERYKETRGHDHLAKVLKNLDYLAAHPVAEQMTIAVLDENPERLAESEAAIAKRFADTPFQVTGYKTMNRAGLVPEAGQTFDHEKLAGCDCIGSRAVEHIQIDAEGNLILCCQDYHSEEKIGTWQQPGDLQRLLSSERARTLRNWVHGIEEAPVDFICRKCEFAIPAAT